MAVGAGCGEGSAAAHALGLAPTRDPTQVVVRAMLTEDLLEVGRNAELDGR